jgi:ATP-binding cassette subfamily B protein
MTETTGRGRAALRPLAMLLPYVLRYRVRLLAAGSMLVVAAGATLAIPIAVRRMIDHGFEPGQGALIDQYFAVLVLVVGVLAMASAMRYHFVTVLGERVVTDLRRDLFAHLLRLSPGFFDGVRSGEMVSRLTADTTQIRAVVGASVSIALRNLLLFLGATGMMIVTAPGLSTIVLGAIPAIVLPLILFGRRVRAATRRSQDMLADAAGYATEQIGAVRTVQAFNHERPARARFDAANESAYVASRNATFARALLTGIAIFLVFASVVGVLWIGAQDVLAGRMTAGALSQFVLFAVFAAGALGELSNVWGEIAQAAGAAERIDQVFRERPAIAPPAAPLRLPEPPRGEIAFEHVTFAYPTRPQEAVLRDVSLEVRRGERVALVGPSGAGKSTVFQLVLRAYDPDQGRVLVDGVPVAAADPAAVRARLALVPQDATIFADTLEANIRYGRPDASDEAVRRAAETALVDEFAAAMSDGYATRIGERGVTLSGGQRQRVAIARAVLRDAPILLLDEATSALDAESERLVQHALDRLMRGRTTLVIAHRLATVLAADRILVLDRGRIVEEGTHASLVAAGGLYARLAKLQFGEGETLRAAQ